MEPAEQIQKLFDESSRLLVCLPQQPNTDDCVAALALKAGFEPQFTVVDIVSDGYTATDATNFLPKMHCIRPTLPPLKQLVVTLDLIHNPLKNISYTTHDNRLDIFLQPEHGSYHEQDISVKKQNYAYDLIVTLGVTQLESLGEVFSQAPDFFYTTPIINIDYHVENDRFGQVNLINLTSKTTSEIVHHLLREFSVEVESQIAQFLLTGIISKTNGLKKGHIPPQLLNAVHLLITAGANMTEINKHLFHIHSLNTLKLWGRVLARLKEEPVLGLVYSLIPRDDFIKTNTNSDNLMRVMDEFIQTYPDAHMQLLLWQESDEVVHGVLKTNANQNALDLLASLKPIGRPDHAEFTLAIKKLLEAEQTILQTLRKKIQQGTPFN